VHEVRGSLVAIVESRPTPVGDRRSSPRVRIEVEVSYATESNFFVGLTGDVSEGGLFLATYRAIPIGAQLDLELWLPDGKLEAHGVVRWVREASEGSPPGVGVAFEPLDEASRARVHAFCAERAPWYYEHE